MKIVNVVSAEVASEMDSARKTPVTPSDVDERIYTSGMRSMSLRNIARKSDFPACPRPTKVFWEHD